MSNAFLRIRQALVREKKYAQYIAIALGEMLLIVVGILVALKIDNWNQTKQDYIIIESYLEKINANIATDLNNLDSLIDLRRKSLLNTDTILKYYKNEQISDPKLFELGFQRLFVETRFYTNSSAYESLKSSGFLRNIENGSIEEGLNSYYSLDEKISYLEESFHSITQPIEEHLSEKGFYIEYSEMFQWNHQDTLFFTYKDLQKYPDVQSTFIRAKMWLESLINAYSELSKRGYELQDILNNGD